MNDMQNGDVSSFRRQSLAIPVAIVFGFGLIAAAIFFSGNTKAPTDTTTVENADRIVDQGTQPTGTLNPITETDHIRGNPNAPILLIEYSDFDCPFCKNFHETMMQILDEYGVDGKVAWVYRHFPLEKLHPSAPRIAEASECIAKLGGNDAFWKFADLIFGERGINEQTNMTRLPEFAKTAGVDEGAFNDCLESEVGRAAVEEDFSNGVSIGVKGTPHTVIVIGDQQATINGAQPYSVVKQIVESLVKQIAGEEATAN